ncbi:MAG: PQQ-binding-like beta-propeller repeat protein [Candidatus Binatia bacterium]
MSRIAVAILAGSVLLVACSNNSSPSCSLNGGTQLAATAWPKFHADAVNSGRSPVDLSINDGSGGMLFPQDGQPSIGSTQVTPILGDGVIYLGSSDTNVYALQYDGTPVTDQTNLIVLAGPVTASPLLGADGTVFVPGVGILAQYRTDGTVKNNAALPGVVAAAPNIWSGDGTTYMGTLSGGFLGICPNGVPRYTLGFPSTQSPAAIAQDPNEPDQTTPIIVAAGLAGQVRAYNIRGRQRWSFYASSTIDAAVLIDDDLPNQRCDVESGSTPTPTRPGRPSPTPTPDTALKRFFIADQSGRMYSGNLANGQQCQNFAFSADAPVSASPAFGRDATPEPRLYVGDLGGTLYALDRNTGAIRWTFQAPGPILSSPAVATGGSNDIIVFGADVLGTVSNSDTPVAIGGMVYAIRDDGTQATLLWTFDVGASIGTSSPAIYTDGTVYIGRAGQRMGSGDDCIGGDIDPTLTCTVNVGGALYAIGAGAP